MIQRTRIWRAALFPLWVIQLFTGAKSFTDNPLIGSKRLNRLGLHRLRLRAAHALAWSRRRRLARMVPEALRQQFERDGIIIIPDVMPVESFIQLRGTILDAKFPAREMLQGDTITRRIAIDQAARTRIPAFADLLDSALWQGLMRYVASYNVEPLYYVQSILKRGVDAPPDPQVHAHADAFHPTMKAWYFLKDVNPGEGCFSYVRGSHRLNTARLDWETQKSQSLPDMSDPLTSRGSFRVTDAELMLMGLPPPSEITVKANTLVVADTFGFHARGPSGPIMERVEIWAYSRRTPFLPFTGLDLLSLRWIAPRRIPLLWKLRDLCHNLAPHYWTPTGNKRPLD